MVHGPEEHSFLWQALPNGAPASKPSSPALIETKEPNGSAHASGSTSEEAEEQEAQVGVESAGMGTWGRVGCCSGGPGCEHAVTGEKGG